ncbi:356_t:CDS:2, partial [Racocetra persica]
LSQEEDSDLQAVTQFLQPFYEITNILSGSTYITLGLSALLMDDIIDVISSYIQDSSSFQFLKTAAIQMIEKLNQYIDYIYDKAAFIASILDSRIKLELIPVNMNTPENQNYFSQIFQEYSDPTDELTKYLNEATLPININPLEWWKLNSFHFPVMSQMVKDFFAIQATSVPSEQIFSKAGDTIWAKYARFSEKSVQSLMYTSSWLEHGIKFHKD